MATTPNFDLTPKQGQYLAFIYYYTKLNGQPPAEADFQRYFGVSPPSVHNMIVTLDKRGFISREAGRARSIRLLVDRDQLPDLD
jgi:repressor LexA